MDCDQFQDLHQINLPLLIVKVLRSQIHRHQEKQRLRSNLDLLRAKIQKTVALSMLIFMTPTFCLKVYKTYRVHIVQLNYQLYLIVVKLHLIKHSNAFAINQA